MEDLIAKELYKSEKLYKEIIAFCDGCNDNFKFYYLGISKDIITDKVIKEVGLNDFIKKYGKALILYECDGCKSSKTLLTLQQYGIFNYDNI